MCTRMYSAGHQWIECARMDYYIHSNVQRKISLRSYALLSQPISYYLKVLSKNHTRLKWRSIFFGMHSLYSVIISFKWNISHHLSVIVMSFSKQYNVNGCVCIRMNVAHHLCQHCSRCILLLSLILAILFDELVVSSSTQMMSQTVDYAHKRYWRYQYERTTQIICETRVIAEIFETFFSWFDIVCYQSIILGR